MAGIKNIRDLYKKVGEKGLREVLEGEIRVTEKFDAYRFAFEKNPHDYKIYFYGKNGKAPLSKIDRTVNDLYEAAISYIENLPADIKKAIPPRHRFGFSWFPNSKPLTTEYSRIPKNGLILTDITVRNRQWEVTNEVKDNKIFERWSKIFKTEFNQPVFEGTLDEKTINSLIEMSKHDYTLSSLNESSIYTEGMLKGNIEALVFESANQLFKITDVIAEEKRVEKRSHLFDILLLDICEHLNAYNIESLSAVSIHPDEAYLEVVNEIFNDFVEKRGKDFLDSGLERPRFLDKSGNFNRSWVKNPKTLAIIESNKKYEYLYTVFLTNLRKPKYPSGLLNEAVVQKFNKKIEEIDNVVSDDYSFLEFNSILKENNESNIDSKPIDIEKAVMIMQSFFDGNRKSFSGKEPVNVIVCNCAELSNSVLQEAERLFKLNGKRCILFHDVFAAKKSYYIEEEVVNKILESFVENNREYFIGYMLLNHPYLLHVFKKLGPEFLPNIISCFDECDDFRLEENGIKAVLGESSPNIQIIQAKSRHRKNMLKAIEDDSYREFCQHTPQSLHFYWPVIKSAFDKHIYR
jgi:hypothetical protein